MPSINELESKFPTLKGTIELLIVDPNPRELQMLTSLLEKCFIYSTTYAASKDDAVRAVTDMKKTTISLSELCITETPDDEPLPLLHKQGKRLPVICITGKQSTETGFRLKELGVAAVFSKPLTQRSCIDIVRSINNQYLDSLLQPLNGYKNDTTVLAICDTIRKRKPKTVEKWAAYSGFDISHVRRKWNMGFDSEPKHICMLYSFLSRMFTLVSRNMENISGGEPCFTQDEIRKFQRYFYRNKEAVDYTLSRSCAGKCETVCA